MREDRGRSRGFDDSRFRERVEVLSPDLTLETLTQVINILCLDKLGLTWNERFGELKAYKEHYAHCNVPARWDENQSLSRWVNTQRRCRRGGVLSEDRIQQLSQIGFVWEPFDAAWEEKFSKLRAFQATYGHCNIPMVWSEDKQLVTWVSHQRRYRKQGKLSEERIRRLDEIAFVWNTLDALWEERFAELTAFKATHDHCNVPIGWPENPQLRTWVNEQRKRKKKGTLSEDCIQRLNQIGLVWDAYDTSWEERFAELTAFKATHGHCNVPIGWSENPQLGTWVNEQRKRKKKGTLSGNRTQRLNEIGLV
jgi:hypothetical protein